MHNNSEQAKSLDKIFLFIVQAIELVIDASQRQRSKRKARRCSFWPTGTREHSRKININKWRPRSADAVLKRIATSNRVRDTYTRAWAYTLIRSASERESFCRAVRVICRRRRLPAVARRRIVSAFGDEMSSEFDTVRRTRLAEPSTRHPLLLRARYPLPWKPWRQRLRLFWLAGRRARQR